MVIRFFYDDPLVEFTHGRANLDLCHGEDLNHRFAHMAFVRQKILTFVPREVLLLLEKQYSEKTQFGLTDHQSVIKHIALLIHEVRITHYNSLFVLN